jgi:hypothetical protein
MANNFPMNFDKEATKLLAMVYTYILSDAWGKEEPPNQGTEGRCTGTNNLKTKTHTKNIK